MSILLAISEQNFTDIIRNGLVGNGFDVMDKDVLHRNYLNEIIEYEKPSMVIVHDVYLPSDFTEQSAIDDEMLELISYWRSKYDNNLRVVYLCERDRKDPFLGNLVARNVLDIFNERQISEKVFLKQLSEEPRFINVSRFGIGGLEVEFEDIPEEEVKEEPPEIRGNNRGERTKQVFTKITETTKSVVDAGTEWNRQRTKTKSERPPKETEQKQKKISKETNSNSDVDLSETIDLMPIPKEVYARTQVIGTVIVAVAGVKPHLGSTHTAMAIAAYLQKRKNSVALIELNTSEDFERIHALYEGEKNFIRNESTFTYSGIEHYKFRENIRLGEIMATYEYVVLDFGSIEDTAFYEEYLRSHVRVLLVSPYEWKQHWIDSFCEKVENEGSYLYVVPFAEKENVKDMEERLPNLHIVPFPSVANPYKSSDEVEESISTIMTGFLKDHTVGFSKRLVIVASIASALLTVLIISVIALL